MSTPDAQRRASGRAPAVSGARAAAMSCIARQARRFPELDLRPPDAGALDARDAALLRAIDQAVRRRWLTLTTVLESHVRRPWIEHPPPVRAALLVGAAQLLLLDRLPDHAVINDAVNWVKAGRGRSASGMVNAVLRRVAELRVDRHPAGSGATYAPSEVPLEDGRVLRLVRDVFSPDPMAQLAEQTSHPVALLRRWAHRLGEQRMEALARHDLCLAPVILTGFEGLPPGCSPHDAPGFAVLDDVARLDEVLAAGPSVRVQDPGAAEAVAATRSLAPRVVADICAGRGTKTRQLLHQHPGARVVATDRNPQRVATLKEAFAAAPDVEVVDHEALDSWAGRVDLVLVDAPCSNTATLARRVEARYRVSDDTLKALVSMQRQALVDGLRVLAEGGRLVYATCSLESEENEEQIKWLTRWHPLRLEHQGTHWPAGAPGDPPAGYRDGGFVALLRHAGTPEATAPPG